uniref:Uncharacterized protein n=1 Tax=Sphenodon punctatus TaxID=8508 RepID=A0A8D0L9Y7_SPHPU
MELTPAVRVSVPAGGPVLVEKAEPQQVDQEPGSADTDHDQGLLDLVGLGEALDGLQQDGEAKRGEEDGVDQGAHHLGPHPAEGVLLGGAGALGEAHGHQRHHQSHDIGEHVEGVGEHGQRGGQPAHRHLHHEEQEGQRQHAQQPRPPALPPPRGIPCPAARHRPRRSLASQRRGGLRPVPSSAGGGREGGLGPPRGAGKKEKGGTLAPMNWSLRGQRRAALPDCPGSQAGQSSVSRSRLTAAAPKLQLHRSLQTV